MTTFEALAFMIALTIVIILFLILHFVTRYRRCKRCGTIFKKLEHLAYSKHAMYEICPKCGQKHPVLMIKH